jgi:hypothetical protein
MSGPRNPKPYSYFGSFIFYTGLIGRGLRRLLLHFTEGIQYEWQQHESLEPFRPETGEKLTINQGGA